MPRWMRLIFLVFLGYILYLGNFSGNTAPLATPIESADTTTPQNAETEPDIFAPSKPYNALANFTDGDRWRRALDPTYVGDPNFKDVQAGVGTAAGCGSSVTIRLRGTLSDGGNFDATHNETKPLTFVVGQAPYAALNEGVIGMQKGSVRQLKASPMQVFKGTPLSLDSVLFRIEMDSISPSSGTDLPMTMMQVAVPFDSDLPQARCGEAVPMKLLWFDNAGRKARSDTATLMLGKAEFGVGIDRLVHGIREGEVRFGVLPPAWQKPGAKTLAHVVASRVAPAQPKNKPAEAGL
jgi:hypothetical protein